MFRCSICNQVSRERTRDRAAEKPVRIVVERREKVYPRREGVIRVDLPYGRVEYRDDPGGKGWEIARELVVHETCAVEREAQYGCSH